MKVIVRSVAYLIISTRAKESNNKQTISFGVIFRDSKGQLQHASAIYQNLNNQVEIAAWDTILFALQKAHLHGQNQIQILCDSKDIVFDLQRKKLWFAPQLKTSISYRPFVLLDCSFIVAHKNSRHASTCLASFANETTSSHQRGLNFPPWLVQVSRWDIEPVGQLCISFCKIINYCFGKKKKP